MPLDMHRMFRTLLLLVLVLTPASGLSAADQAPYVVNAILGITGSAALQGQEEAKTLGVVETLVNRQGGIGGRPIKLVVNDDQNNPPIDVRLVARFAAEKVRYFTALKDAEMQWNLPTSLAWDPAWLFVDALRKLGTNATVPQVRDYLSSLHGWVGVIGTYDFQKTPQRGIAQDAIFIDRWDTAKAEFNPVGRPGGYLR